MHPSQPERRVLVIGARLDLGAHARERHAMDSFEVVAVAPLDHVGAREVALKNSALPFERREALFDFRFFDTQPRRYFASRGRPASLERAPHEFCARIATAIAV